jgi:urease accessory protein
MLTGAGVLSALSGRKLLLPFATLGMMLAAPLRAACSAVLAAWRC